jgi:hypothetical protein
MAQVKSIEIAQRDDTPAQMRWNRRAALQPLHAFAYRSRAVTFQRVLF